MEDKIRILIADDHPLFREGVATTLNNHPKFQIVGQAETVKETLDLVGDLLPDVVLLDITIPSENGIFAAEKISSAYPVVIIIMLTASDDEDDLMNALKAGARGYIIKGVNANELTNAVLSVVDGGTYISKGLASTLLFELTQPKDPDPLTDLSERETQILQLVSEGLTNREIGERLFLAEKTIKHYMTNVLQKLHVRSRVEAALLHQKNKLNNT
jgi:two-component system nitrate/nitrite response regulator NarL